MKDCPFPTDKCPLCGAELLQTDGRTTFFCREVIPLNPRSASHYEATPKFQSIIIQPFFFQTISPENVTNIHKLNPFGADAFMSLPMITDWSQPDKILERVNNLIPFL
jgi:hypothetical protein